MTPWRIGTAVLEGRPTPVVAHEGGLTRLSTIAGAPSPHTVREFIDSGSLGIEVVEAAVRGGVLADVGTDPVWAPPVMPAKLVCIGANYAEHNAEMLGEVTSPYPYAFLKPPSTTLVGGGRSAALPTHAVHIDYEAELSVIIGAHARNVDREEALAYVFGFAPFNDLSARDWVRSPTVLGLDWVMSKAFDESAPMGPLITPSRFVPDPDDLSIRLWVNDELRQDSRTSGMVFDVASLVAHLSTVMTLEPGDVIATGTPSGVGMGATPPAWLRAGDVVRVEVELLGDSLVTPVAGRDEIGAGDHRARAGRDLEPSAGEVPSARTAVTPFQPIRTAAAGS